MKEYVKEALDFMGEEKEAPKDEKVYKKLMKRKSGDSENIPTDETKSSMKDMKMRSNYI